MGKSLIVKGADFSECAIGTIYESMPLVNGSINSADGSYGNWDYNNPSYNDIRAKTAKDSSIKVASGSSLTILGTKGLGVGYFVYGAKEPTTANCLGRDYCVSSPKLNTEGLDSFVYTNNTGRDVYIIFVFKYNGTDGTHTTDAIIDASDLNIRY